MNSIAQPPNSMTILGIFKRFWLPISGTLTLLLVENVLVVLYPFLVGLAIDDLISGGYTKLTYLASALGVHFVVGVSRRLYDTRVYSRIYAIIVSEMVDSQRTAKEKNSQIVARVELLRELVDFFEQELPMGLMSVASLVGAIVMLAVLDWRISMLCLGAIAVLAVLYGFTKGAFHNANVSLNDAYERQADVVTQARPIRVRRYFNLLRGRAVHLSDLDAGLSASLELMLITVFIGALLLAATGGDPTTGGIVATMTYVFEFYESLLLAPHLLQQRIRLSDISRRTAAA